MKNEGKIPMQNIITAAVMCLLLAIAAYFIVPDNKYKRLYILLAVISVILRLVTVAYLYSDGVDTFGTDGLLYHRIGKWVSRQLGEGTPVYAVKYVYTWYTVLVGVVYHIFGINRFLVSYINIALAFLSALLLLKIALGLKYRFSNAAFISLSFLFFPNLILWTSDSRKEALTIFICVLCFYCLQRFLAGTYHVGMRSAGVYHEGTCSAAMCPAGIQPAGNVPSKPAADSTASEHSVHDNADFTANTDPDTSADTYKHASASIFRNIRTVCIIVLSCLLIWLGTLVRIYMVIPMAAGILLSLLLSYIKNREKLYLLFGLAIIISSLIILIFTVCPLLEDYHAVTFPEEIGDFSTDMANKVETIKLIASNRDILLTALNYFLLPYPGNTGIAEIRGSVALNVIVSIDMIFWYLCLLLMVPGIIAAVKNKESFLLGLLAFLTLYSVINIIAVENVPDTIYRYRSLTAGLSLLFIDWKIISQTRSRIFGLHQRAESLNR